MITTPFGLPWLTILVATPALGALGCARVSDPRDARRLAVATATLALALSLDTALSAFATPGFLVDPYGLDGGYLLGVDVTSGSLLLLVSLIGLAVSLASPRQEASPSDLARALALLACALLAFSSLDLRLFCLAWTAGVAITSQEVWSRARSFAPLWFVSQAAGLVALAGVLFVLERAVIPLERVGADGPIALCVAAAVLVRQGMFPLHSWLPGLHRAGRTGVVALTFAPQLGLYLLLRVGVDANAGRLLLVLAAGSAVYGALLGLAQTDLRRAVGWLASSQSALVATGVLCASQTSTSGALLLWVSSGLALTGLLLATAALESRFGPVDLRETKGLAASVPRLAVAFLLLGLASVGLPGSLGFVSEDLLFHGALETAPAAGVALIVATALNGFTVLRLFYRAFHGSKTSLRLPDLLPRERLVLLALLAILLGAGLCPAPWVERAQIVAGQR